MPWKECHVMDERLRFVARRLEGEKMAPLCAEFGISRKTGYGPFEVDGPVTALISTPSGGTFSADGLLGTGFLRRFKVTFDYSRQQLWLEPNGQSRRPQLFDASGIEVRPTDAHEFAIVAIATDSAASAAGLRVGDLLKQV